MESFQQAPDGILQGEKDGSVLSDSLSESPREGSGPLTENEAFEQAQQGAEEYSIDSPSYKWNHASNSDDGRQESQSMPFIDKVTESQPYDAPSQQSQPAASDPDSHLLRHAFDDGYHAEVKDVDDTEDPQINQHHGSSPHSEVLRKHSQKHSDSVQTIETYECNAQVKSESSSPSYAREVEGGGTVALHASWPPNLEPSPPFRSEASFGHVDLGYKNTTKSPADENSDEASDSQALSQLENRSPSKKIKVEAKENYFDAIETSSTNINDSYQVERGAPEVRIETSASDHAYNESGSAKGSTPDETPGAEKVLNTGHGGNVVPDIKSEGTSPDNNPLKFSPQKHQLGDSFASSGNQEGDQVAASDITLSTRTNVSEVAQKHNFPDSQNSVSERTYDAHFFDTSSSSIKVEGGLDEESSAFSPRTKDFKSGVEGALTTTPPPAGKKPKSQEISFFKLKPTAPLEILTGSENIVQAELPNLIFSETSPKTAIERDNATREEGKRQTSSNSSPAYKPSTPTSAVIILDDDEKEESQSQYLADAKPKSRGRGRPSNASKMKQEDNADNDPKTSRPTTSLKQSTNKKVNETRAPSKLQLSSNASKSKKENEIVNLGSDDELQQPALEPSKPRNHKRNAVKFDQEESTQQSAKRHKSSSEENDDPEYMVSNSATRKQPILRGINTRGTQRSLTKPEVVISPRQSTTRESIDMTGDDGCSTFAEDQQSTMVVKDVVRKVEPKSTSQTSKKRQVPAAETKPAKKAKSEPAPKVSRSKKKIAPRQDDDEVSVASTSNTFVKPGVRSVAEMRPIADPTGGFPRFDDGDVYISLSAEDISRSYTLHSETLGRLSTFFKNGLQRDVVEQDPVLRRTVEHLRARFCLKFNLNTSGVRLCRTPFTLVADRTSAPSQRSAIHDQRRHEDMPYEDASDKSIKIASSPNLLPQEARIEAENRKNKMTTVLAQVENNIKQRFVENCDNLFRAYYNQKLNIDHKNLDKALEQAEDLLELATKYDSLYVVQQRLPEYIFNFQRELYKAVARDPPRWLKLSLQLQSAPIFKEAVLHIVGNYPKWQDLAFGVINSSPNMIKYLERKITHFKAFKNDIDEHLLRNNHWRVSNDPDTKMKEPTIFDVEEPDYNVYLVNMAWKDWYGQSLSRAKEARAQNHEDATMYREIASGGDCFLNPNFICSRLEKLRGVTFTEEETAEIHKDLAKVKKYARDQVEELCINESMVVAEHEGITHFLCVIVPDKELPWTTNCESQSFT